ARHRLDSFVKRTHFDAFRSASNRRRRPRSISAKNGAVAHVGAKECWATSPKNRVIRDRGSITRHPSRDRPTVLIRLSGTPFKEQPSGAGPRALGCKQDARPALAAASG